MNTLLLMSVMAGAAVLGSVGQIALKKGSALALSPSNPWLWAFVAAYGLAVLINFWAYKVGGQVSVLYPVIATSYIWSAIFAWKFLGETITGWTISGILLIVIGVGVIGWGVH